MAVFTEESARANIRNLNGKRVFFLAEGNHLTPSAREWLRKERIEILRSGDCTAMEYRTVSGAVLGEKPEDMTHLRTGVLVPKEHPRIRFRGEIDGLESEILLVGRYAVTQGFQNVAKNMKELLDKVRMLIRCEVMDEPFRMENLCGYSMDQLREQSHHPEKYFDQPHFMPEQTDSELLLRLNMLRTGIRKAELSACDAFRARDGGITRTDLIAALNRMSSLVYLMMIIEKKEASRDGRSG